MANQGLSEQDQASMTGPRDVKEPGDPLWCWQTISALQSIWKSVTIDHERYMRIWAEAEEHRVWEKVPQDAPYGSKEAMLEHLAIGDDVTARARVAVQAMPARPLGKRGGRKSQHAGQQIDYGSTRTSYLTARIARDRPDVWERMKRGEFASVAEAAREAGIDVPKPKRVTVNGDKGQLAQAILRLYGPEQFTEFAKEVIQLVDHSETVDG